MKNILTIRILYQSTLFSEMEYIKTFLQFIGCFVISTSFNDEVDLVKKLETQDNNHDLDILINSYFITQFPEGSASRIILINNNCFYYQIPEGFTSRIIELVFSLTTRNDNGKYQYAIMEKSKEKSQQNSVLTKAQLRECILNAITDFIWRDEEVVKEELKSFIPLYLENNTFLAIQYTQNMRLLKWDLFDKLSDINYRYKRIYSDGRYASQEFYELYKALKVLKDSAKSVYIYYAYANASFYVLYFYQQFWNVHYNEVNEGDIIDTLATILNRDRDFLSSYFLAYQVQKYEGGIEYLCELEKQLAVRRSKIFLAYFQAKLAYFYYYIGGNKDAVKMYLEAALQHDENCYQAKVLLAYYNLLYNRFDDSLSASNEVIKLLYNEELNLSIDFLYVFRCYILAAKIHYNCGKKFGAVNAIEKLTLTTKQHMDAIWVRQIMDECFVSSGKYIPEDEFVTFLRNNLKEDDANKFIKKYYEDVGAFKSFKRALKKSYPLKLVIDVLKSWVNGIFTDYEKSGMVVDVEKLFEEGEDDY